MPKAAPFLPKPAIEKIPLAQRKDIRDNYDSKKADFESQITNLLGFPVAINVNPSVVLAYATPDSVPCGSLISGYVQGFLYALKSYVDTYGDIGKEYFKKSVTASEITVAVNELGEKAPTISADVEDGLFRILFHQDKLGYNQDYLSEHFAKAIDSAPHEGFSLIAKHSIDSDYNSEIEELTEAIGAIINVPDVVLDSNFEANYTKLLKKEDNDWQRSFGRATLEYFQDGLKYQLKTQGFEGDEMLQEGLLEALQSKTFRLSVVDSITSGYSQVVIEEGVVHIKVPIDGWYYNIYQAGSGLLDLL